VTQSTGADSGICKKGPVPPIPPFFFLSLLHPEPRPKTNLVRSKAVTKPLVTIILNILSTIFYVFDEINRRWCCHH